MAKATASVPRAEAGSLQAHFRNADHTDTLESDSQFVHTWAPQVSVTSVFLCTSTSDIEHKGIGCLRIVPKRAARRKRVEHTQDMRSHGAERKPDTE
jgi:hypothetical protein